jgi:hypothetical protein
MTSKLWRRETGGRKRLLTDDGIGGSLYQGLLSCRVHRACTGDTEEAIGN